MNTIKLKNDKYIGGDHPIFIIAEAGVNHNGSLEIAKQLIDAAVYIGADAVKFQSFNADEIILKNAPKAKYHIETTGSDNIQSWYELLKSQEISIDMHKKLIEYASSKNIIFLSTPYDKKSAEILIDLDIELIKIASTDNNNLPFLKFLASKKIPLILSTAMCNIEDVDLSINTFQNINFHDLILLQCTGSYPAPYNEANLNVISTYRQRYNLIVGYSDHVVEHEPALASVALGSKVYERHLTIDKSLPGPDHRASSEPSEFKEIIEKIRIVENSLGNGLKIISKSEIKNRGKLKKFIVSKEKIKKGDLFTVDNITTKRTGGLGLEPKYFDKLIQKSTNQDIEKDTPILNNFVKW